MTTIVADHTTESITIETPSGEWIPILYDAVMTPGERSFWDKLLEEDPKEFAMMLSSRLHCNVSVEKRTQITARFK
jgi:hypothetical protein